MNLLLVNPFSHLVLPLPPQSTFQYQFRSNDFCQITPEQNLHAFICKCILSAPPASHSCVVLAISGERCSLSFARPGDEAWISIESSQVGYVDAIFFQGQFYAVCRKGIVSLIDISCPQPIAVDFASPPEGVDDDTKNVVNRFYLVEISGYIYFVAQFWYPNYRVRPIHGTIRFKVRKLDFETRQWVPVKDLGNHAVFLGSHTSFAILASNYPRCRPNCIYFTDHYCLYRTPVWDMGVYDLRDETVKDIFLATNTHSKIARPVLIMPSF